MKTDHHETLGAQENEKSSMNGSMVRRLRANPERLPIGHPVEWLAAAKHLHREALPPFVERDQDKNKAGDRRLVILQPIDDKLNKFPFEAEIVNWPWSPGLTFSTTDVEGRRLIVKEDCRTGHYLVLGVYRHPPNDGPPYKTFLAAKWKEYLGDFEEFYNDSKIQHANHVQTRSDTPHLGSSTKIDGRAQPPVQKDQSSPQLDWRPSEFSQISPADRSSARPSITNTGDAASQRGIQERQRFHEAAAKAPRALQAKARDLQVSLPSTQLVRQNYGPPQSVKDPVSGPRQDASTPKGREEHPLIGPHEFVQVSPSQVSPEINQDRHLSSQPTDKNTTESPRQHYDAGQGRPNESDHRSRPHENTVDAPQASGPQSNRRTSADAKSLPRPAKRRRQTSISSPLNPRSPQLPPATRSPSARSPAHPPPPPSAYSQPPTAFPTPPTSAYPQSTTDPSSSSSAPSLLLAPHKQSRTTLFVAIPYSTDAVPLKLRSCMTLSSLFTTVLAISAPPTTAAAAATATSHDDDHVVVSGIRATFTWKTERDVDRTILLKRDVQDCFEVLLEIVDGAPCWGEEGGRCGVAVEVVLA